MNVELDDIGDSGGEVAVYRRIEQNLRMRIQQGQWPEGSMLPSRRVLAKHYGVSQLTVERAVSGMIAEGLLRTDERRGTFVAVSGSQRVADRGRQARAARTIGIVGALYESRNDHLELNNFWVRLLVHSIERACAGVGYISRFFNRVQAAEGPVSPLDAVVQEACLAEVDALVVIGFGFERDEIEEGVGFLEEVGIPVVCITAGELRRPVPHVYYDNYGAGYQAAQHLLRNGYREILFFAPQTALWAQERIAGARAACLHAGLPPEALRAAPESAVDWRQEVDPQELGYAAARVLLDAGARPSAVICHNDGAAHGFVRAAEENGLVIGEDVAIVGFDDHPTSRVLQLTSLRPPVEAMGAEASRLIVAALSGETANARVCLRWQLIGRHSTRRANGAGGEQEQFTVAQENAIYQSAVSL